MVPWEVGVRAPEGGMLSCFNLCKCPPEWRWRKCRTQCDLLYLANDPSDQNCRWPSKASAFYLSVSVRALSMFYPLFSICTAPLEGRLAEEHPFVPLQTDCGCLSCCQCLCVVSQGVAWRTCFGFSALPLSMSPGPSFLNCTFVLDQGMFVKNPFTAQWYKNWGLETMTAETLLKLQVSRG